MLDPFEHLPYDKMIEICESLDDESLGNLVNTSKKAYETCQWVLDIKREKLKTELPEKLIGPWLACRKISDQSYQRFIVSIKLFQDQIKVKHATSFETLLSDMYIEDGLFIKYIDLDDLLELKDLYSTLLEKGYKRINRTKDIYAVNNEGEIRVHDPQRKRTRYVYNIPRMDITRLLNTLNVSVAGHETTEELMGLLIEELDERGKLLICR